MLNNTRKVKDFLILRLVVESEKKTRIKVKYCFVERLMIKRWNNKKKKRLFIDKAVSEI